MMYKSSKIASKSSSKCLKPVSNPYMMSKHDLIHFSKNRNKSILKIFFPTMHQQNFPEITFSAEYRPNKIRNVINTPWAFPEKFIPQ